MQGSVGFVDVLRVFGAGFGVGMIVGYVVGFVVAWYTDSAIVASRNWRRSQKERAREAAAAREAERAR